MKDARCRYTSICIYTCIELNICSGIEELRVDEHLLKVVGEEFIGFVILHKYGSACILHVF